MDNVKIISNEGIFSYDPSKSQAYTNRFKATTGTPSIASSKLRLNASTVYSLESFKWGRLVMNLNIPAAPTAGDARIFGFRSPAYTTAGSVYFEVTGATFRAVSYDTNGTAETTAITWDVTWSNAVVEYRIEWRGDKILFYVADSLKATHSVRIGEYPQSIVLSNGNADNVDVSYVVMNDSGQKDAGEFQISIDEFPAASAATDNYATPTTTDVKSFGMVYDGATWDFMRGNATAGVQTNMTHMGGVALLLDGATYTPGTQYLAMPGIEIDDPTALATETEGKIGNKKGDLSGRLIVTQGTLGAGEFLSEGPGGVIATVPTPLATSTFTSSKDVSSALEASKIVKASAGNLYRTYGVIDKSAPTGMYYVLHLNSATLTGDGAVTHLITPIPVNHTNGTDSSFDTGHFFFGTYASAGIVRVLSSSMVTKAITSAYMFATSSFL